MVVGSDASELETRAGSLDLLITTQDVAIDWQAYLGLLAPHGRLHMVGAVLEPIPVGAFDLIMPFRSISGSPVATPSDTRSMVEFAGRHGIQPRTEHFPLESINEAFDHLMAGKARYRLVLDVRS